MKKYLLLIFIPFLLNSCKNNSEAENPDSETVAKNFEKIDEIHWLLGTWVNEFTPEFSQESWTKENDSTFSAFSFTLVHSDTVFAEKMSLQQKEGDLLLTVVEVNQNDEAPVTFKLVSSEENKFVFENKKHDFPKRIVYTHPVKDSLHAWIEGPVDGENRKLHFHFSKENRP